MGWEKELQTRTCLNLGSGSLNLRSTSPGSFPWQELTVSSRGLHGTKCNGYLMGEIIVDQTGFRTLDLLLGALTTELFGLII